MYRVGNNLRHGIAFNNIVPWTNIKPYTHMYRVVWNWTFCTSLSSRRKCHLCTRRALSLQREWPGVAVKIVPFSLDPVRFCTYVLVVLINNREVSLNYVSYRLIDLTSLHCDIWCWPKFVVISRWEKVWYSRA